jgi:two-component system, NtrC family, nitrogen regulation response regulator GlnG
MTSGRVLLLEDDLALRSLLLDALAGEGFDVIAVDDFPELLEAVANHHGQIVVADFWGNGQHTLPESERQEIRALGALLPLVLLTGRTWAADLSPQEVGARALIRKPFDLEDLMRTIEDVLTDAQA